MSKRQEDKIKVAIYIYSSIPFSIIFVELDRSASLLKVDIRAHPCKKLFMASLTQAKSSFILVKIV